MPPAAEVFVGIDVAKAELVIAIRPSGERWTVTKRFSTRCSAPTPSGATRLRRQSLDIGRQLLTLLAPVGLRPP